MTNPKGTISALQVYQKKREEKGIESVFEEIIAENFPKVGEEIIIWTTKVHTTEGTQGGQHQDT